MHQRAFLAINGCFGLAILSGCQTLPYDSTTDISTFDGNLPVQTQTSMSDVLACTGELIRHGSKRHVTMMIDTIQDCTARTTYTGPTILSNAGSHFVSNALAQVQAPANITIHRPLPEELTGNKSSTVLEHHQRRGDVYIVQGCYTESTKVQELGGGAGLQAGDSAAEKSVNFMYVRQNTDNLVGMDLALVSMADGVELARESGRIVSKKLNNTLEVGLGYKNLGAGISVGGAAGSNLHGQQRSLAEALTASVLWRLFGVPGEQCLERLKDDRHYAVDFRQADRPVQVKTIQNRLVELQFLDQRFADGNLNEATWRAIHEFEQEEKLFPTSESNLEGFYLKLIRVGRERDSQPKHLLVLLSPLLEVAAGRIETGLLLANSGNAQKLADIEIALQFSDASGRLLGVDRFRLGDGEISQDEIKKITHRSLLIPATHAVGVVILQGGRRVIRLDDIALSPPQI